VKIEPYLFSETTMVAKRKTSEIKPKCLPAAVSISIEVEMKQEVTKHLQTVILQLCNIKIFTLKHCKKKCNSLISYSFTCKSEKQKKNLTRSIKLGRNS